MLAGVCKWDDFSRLIPRRQQLHIRRQQLHARRQQLHTRWQQLRAAHVRQHASAKLQPLRNHGGRCCCNDDGFAGTNDDYGWRSGVDDDGSVFADVQGC